MSQPLIPSSNADLATFAATFAATVAADPGAYGMSAPDATALSTAVAAFTASVQSVDAGKAAHAAAVELQRTQRAALVSIIRPVAAQIQAASATTAPLLATAGLPVHATGRSKHAPITPTNLTKTDINEVSHLKWDGNGNAERTVFEIQRARSEGIDEGDWELIASVTAHRYTDKDGDDEAGYRVRARRGLVTSGWSNIAR